DGRIHAVGGIGWRGRNTPAHEVYDPAANQWTALAYVPTARDHLAAAALDGRIYAVGGRIDGNYSRNLSSNEAYDPATNRWERRAPMPAARSGIAAAVLEGRMFVFVARRRRAPSTKCKPTMAGAMAGAIMRVCRRPATVLARRRSRAGFTSSRAGRRPVTRFRPPMRFSCRDAGPPPCLARKANFVAAHNHHP